MVDVFMERIFESPIAADQVRTLVQGAAGCLDLHNARWRGSLLATDGRRMLCHFSAPDAESVRIAFRQSGAAIDALWTGTILDGVEPGVANPGVANVVVQHGFEEPIAGEALQAFEDNGVRCSEDHRVKFERAFVSTDGKRVICLYQASDAASVRLVRRDGKPPGSIWSCRPVPS